MKNFPFYKQRDQMDCGPANLKMISKYYGKIYKIEKLRELCSTTKEGTSLLSLCEASELLNFRAIAIKCSIEELINEAPLPCILHWKQSHFVVLYKIKNREFYVADPAFGKTKYSEKEFLRFWQADTSSHSDSGICLLLEPTPKFYNSSVEFDEQSSFSYKSLLNYIWRYKSSIIQIGLGLLAGSIMQLIFPFLTQGIVDIGIQNANIRFVNLMLLSQLFIFLGRTALEFLRGWILLHLSTRLNITLLSDFFIKLMNLPISYFDVKMTGDILQRINDHSRIERVLTFSSLSALFASINLIVMSIVLIYYSTIIFIVFLVGSIIYFTWILIFMKQREEIDHKRFAEVSKEQSKVIELLNGMQEIKLNNAEKQKRWAWEHIQTRLFKVSIRSLILEQMQNLGSNFLNELKNIIIIYIAANAVIRGDITLGMMLAISSIIGSLNGPIYQLIDFIREAQDAKISLSRLAEVHQKEDEILLDCNKSSDIPANSNIEIQNISFKYSGSVDYVLQDINFSIQSKKITAIVGASGSGKTTLMKLLLKFYEPTQGEIILSGKDSTIKLNHISQKKWRDNIGVVLQDGYIFNDSIANNIAIGVESIDKQRLGYAAKVANISEFISNLPQNYNTKIGVEGTGMSAGQRQRLLIARSVYRNPEIIFFDEATSALDANNEKEIIDNLNSFFSEKTVVVIAHRLSTVRDADQIIVLDRGRIVEMGTHTELLKNRGNYFELIKNQMHHNYV